MSKTAKELFTEIGGVPIEGTTELTARFAQNPEFIHVAQILLELKRQGLANGNYRSGLKQHFCKMQKGAPATVVYDNVMVGRDAEGAVYIRLDCQPV